MSGLVTLVTPNNVDTESLHSVLEPFVTEIENQAENDRELEDNIAEMFGFVNYHPSTKEGQIRTKLGFFGAPQVGERDEYTLDETLYGPKIGYGVVRYFPGSEVTSEAEKWINQGGKEKDLNAVIRQELQGSFGELGDKINSIQMSENEYMLKVFTEGFDEVGAEYGPNSEVYDKERLFSLNHTIIKTGETYTNIVTDGDIDTVGTKYAPLTWDSLRKAVKMLRGMRDGIGKKIKKPRNGIYDLYVSREEEENAKNIISNGNTIAPYNYMGGEASNDNFENVFERDGFRIRLNVVDLLGEPDSTDPENKTIGTSKMWFVLNKTEAQRRKALRRVVLGNISVEFSRDPKTKKMIATAEKHSGAEILYPEIVVGSKGDESDIV